MAEDIVKLTVDTVAAEFIVEETEREKVRRVMREAGMLADTSWMKGVLPGVEPATLEEAREWLAGVPLSDWIIEDRGPR
jgi:hypothetical protein